MRQTMIDTSKYEGHTPGQWSVTSIRDGSIPWNTADEELCADAPLLLAEVKRLRELLESVIENAAEPSGDDGTGYRYCEIDTELVEMIEEEIKKEAKKND